LQDSYSCMNKSCYIFMNKFYLWSHFILQIFYSYDLDDDTIDIYKYRSAEIIQNNGIVSETTLQILVMLACMISPDLLIF